jgi:spermidine synthase
MSASLFVERHAAGLAFYINGNLQFDTADEAIYHEFLTVPALALAVQQFKSIPLRVLICGGGDGLAARDVLRFPQVQDVTLVDYDPEVLALAQSEFAPYNQGSLTPDANAPLGSAWVTVYTQDAFEFVQNLPDACYHVAIADFTCPTRPEEMTVFSLEWFTQVRRVLHPQGIFALNGVSATKTPTAYWCLYQTLLAAGFYPKPMQLSIPSFERLGYGTWGFFLASAVPIERSEIEQLTLPKHLRELTLPRLLATFCFEGAIAAHRHNLNLNTLAHPHLFYYLLNPPLTGPTEPEPQVDFLDLQEEGTGAVSDFDEMQLEAIAQRWLARVQQAELGHAELGDLRQLIPVQHYHQNSEMVKEWLGYLKALLAEIDPKALVEQLLARSQSLPPKLAQDLKQLLADLKTGKPLTYISTHTSELMTVLAVTLIVANLATPDAVYAKGFSSGFHSGGGEGYRGGSGYHGSYGGSGSSSYNGDGGGFGWIGFLTMLVGGGWLYYLSQSSDRESK